MLTLILGGARSGKSRYAQTLAGVASSVVYIATASAGDDPEMKRRIARHRAERPPHFRTIEAPVALVEALEAVKEGVILVDCMTLWLSNLSYRHRALHPEARKSRILGAVSAFIEAAREREIIVVSNEVGEGVVPDSAVARDFRDLQGLANQAVAREADRVVLMVAGIPLAVKG